MASDKDRELIEKIRTIHITRRRFLQSAAAVAGTAAVGSILGACGGAATPAATGTATSAATQAAAGGTTGQPKKGGILKVAYQTDPTGFDPAIPDTYSSELMCEQMYEPLVEYNNELKIVPCLAESYTTSEDKLTLTFNLRKGVKFHNGEEMTSDDVEFTINRIKDPKTGSPRAAYFANVDHIEKPDKYTVKIVLAKETGPIMAFLATPFSGIVPKSEVLKRGDLQTTPIGTGAFKFVSYEPKKLLKFVKNENYWRKDAAGNPMPYLDGVDAQFISDDVARTAALQAKTVDFSQAVPAKDMQVLSAVQGMMLTPHKESCQWQYTAMNCQRAPWKDNVKLRQAVCYAKDRQGLLDSVYFGMGKPMLGGIMPSWSWAYAPDLASTFPPHGDFEKAKALMAEAGFPNGLETTITTSSAYPILTGEAELHQADLKKIGINAKIINLEWGTMMDQVFGKKDFDMMVCGWGGPFFDPDEFLYQEFHSDQAWNPPGFSDPQVDKLLEEGRNTFDQEKRKAAYLQVQKLIIEGAPLAAGVNSPFLQAGWDYMKNWTFVASGLLSGFREVWLDKG